MWSVLPHLRVIVPQCLRISEARAPVGLRRSTATARTCRRQYCGPRSSCSKIAMWSWDRLTTVAIILWARECHIRGLFSTHAMGTANALEALLTKLALWGSLYV